ncbi:related to Probable 26S protease subunit YTA6 [Zygosaccharomyces bailii]|nr:related to Probable 26S protease subunit YTA6 [Zygosaccharomyces bailii]
MSNEKFAIPANFTLLQSLQLLYSIVASQCENYEKQTAKLELSISDLAKLYRLFDNLLAYMNDGLFRIEKYYKCEGGLADALMGHKDLKRRFEDLQILGQDIRLSRRECNNRIDVLEQIRNSQSGMIKGLFRSRGTKKCKPRFEDEKQEKAAIAAAEKVRQARKDKEMKKVEEEKQRQLELEAEKEKQMEIMIKQQLEAEWLENNAAGRPMDKRKTTTSKRSTASVGSPTIRRTERHSMYVSSPTATRTSLDDDHHHRYVGHATRSASQNSAQKTGTRSFSSPSSNGNGNGSTGTKKRYEYKKPVVRRQQIKSPRSQSNQSRATSPELVATDARGTHREKVHPPRRIQHQSPQTPSASSSPIPVQAASFERNTPVSGDEEFSDEQSDSLTDHYMDSASHGVDPLACRQIMKEIVVADEEIRWGDIAGLLNAKNSLKETVVYPFLRPDLFKGLREPIRGMLLFGPPGTGKTMIARAVATESKSTFFSISASSLLSKYLGESEKLVRALFYMAKKMAPSIIFIDEIDSLLTARSDNENESSRRVKTELLIQWSSLSSATGNGPGGETDSRVLVLAATNLPWAIDEAARRRFSRRLYIPLPEYETRLHHLKKLMSRQNNGLSDVDFQVIAEMTEGFSGSDITALAKEAAMEPIRDLGDALMDADFNNIRPVMVKDFEKAMLTIKMSVSPASLQQYQDWAAGFGSTGA